MTPSSPKLRIIRREMVQVVTKSGINVMYTTEKEDHIIRKTDYEESGNAALFNLSFIQNIMNSTNKSK